MASALARGIGEPALVADIDAAKADALADAIGGEAVSSNTELAERADAVVLCHKPTQLGEVAADVAGHAEVVVDPRRHRHHNEPGCRLPGAAIYRFIPNMPVEVRRGVICYVRGPVPRQAPRRRSSTSWAAPAR